MDIELRIARSLIRELLSHGFKISVNDGGEWVVLRSTKTKEIIDALRSTDSDYLLVRKPTGEKVGGVVFVYGNGADVLADYSISLEPFITKTWALIDKLGG